MKHLLCVLMPLVIICLSHVISLSTKLEVDDQDSLHRIVYALTQRLAQLEVDVSKSYLKHNFDVLEVELQQVKNENRLLRNKLLKLEETLEKILLNNIDNQNPITELKQNQKSMEIISYWSNEDTTPEISASKSASNQIISVNSTDKEDANAKSNQAPSITSATNTNGMKLGRQILIRQSSLGQVAFYAQVTPNEIRFGIGQTIVFDLVMTNVGGAYHVHTGVFIAPSRGVYVFHVSAMLVGLGNYQYLQVSRDGNPVQNLYLLKSVIEITSATMVLELNSGSEVWVKALEGSGSLHGYGYTTFAGWLL